MENIELFSSCYRCLERSPRQFMAIALEGPVCAGKTVTIETLKRTGFLTIPEYSELVSSATRDFPVFPPRNESQAQAGFRFFLNLEETRKEAFDQFRNGGVVFLDRSVYTLLAFENGAFALTGIDILPWAVECIEQNIEKVILPDRIIYIDTPVQVLRQRAEEGGVKVSSFLLTDEFNAGFREFFWVLGETCPHLVTFIDGSQNREAIFRLVRDQVDESKLRRAGTRPVMSSTCI